MIYLNGEFMPIEQARIPVLDRGFIFGDGVYELVPVYGRRPFRLTEHLARLENSLREIRLPNPHTRDEWTRLVAEVVARNPWDDQAVYFQVTRGVAKRDHAFPAGVTPTVFVMSNPLSTPSREALERGVPAVTAADNRWGRCNIKSTSLLANVLLKQLAADAGASETILLRDGLLTEGSASNVFVARAGKLLAPPKTNLILPGITYDLVLELAGAHGVPHEVRPISEVELRGADEIMVTSSNREVQPITVLDGKPVGDGRPGPVFRRLHALYQEYKARLAQEEPAVAAVAG